MPLNTFFSKHAARIAFWAIIGVVLWTNISLKFWNEPSRLVIWDVKAYYVYLPATIIYNDLSLKFVEEHYDEIGDAMFLINGPKGIYYIQTTYGLALLYSPFFLIAHAFTILSGSDAATGYSPPYKIALIASSIFYLSIGLYFLKKFLLKYFSQWVTAITLIAVVLGTNLYYYSTYESPMSHAYNFAIIAVFLYFTAVWYEKTNFWNTLIIGFLIGLITLIRPVNLIVLLFFIFWGVYSWNSFLERIYYLLKSYRWILLMILVFLILWIPQFLYWKYISGSYFFYSYSDMRFFFNNPQVISSLFSYRKGLFLYIPLMVLAYSGIPFLFKKYRGFILPVSVFAAINVYVLSSWCFWWFGGSFGPRSYIDTYAILAIPFAAITSRTLQNKWVIKIPFLIVVSVLIWFNFFQTQQYNNGAINWMGMTKEAYWDSFLRRYPSKYFWDKLRFPDRNYATKGIYYQGDMTMEQIMEGTETTSPLNKDDLEDRERYIRNLDKFIRTQDKWFDQMKEKAAQRGISIDSAIRRDAIWLFEMEKEKQKN